MKFIAGLRVWANGGLGKTPQVFPRIRGSANRRVDLHLPLIASIPGRSRTRVRKRPPTSLWCQKVGGPSALLGRLRTTCQNQVTALVQTSCALLQGNLRPVKGQPCPI